MTKSWVPSTVEARWLVSGLIAGATIGLVLGVAISGVKSSKTENSFDQSRLSAQSLGWSCLNEIYDTSKTFSASYNKTLYSGILSALQERYSLAIKDKPITKPNLTPPKTASISSANQAKTTDVNSTNPAYLDGYGSIDINTATVEQIDSVDRMSTKTAQEIWNYIKKNGPIKSFAQLDDVKGVGEKTIEKLRNQFHISKR